MEEIAFVDVTLRDGQQSLWAERMRTGMMLPIAGALDDAGFDSLEIFAPSHVGKCVRELREDPFERIRLLARRIRKTPLRGNVAGLNLFGHDQPAVYELFLRLLAAAGITQTRISDPWNNPSSWKLRADVARKAGIAPIINITYSISPRHSDDYYAERTRQAALLKPYRLCLKDPGGLLTPERTRTLIPLMLRNCAGVPIELHTHCSTGLGPLCCLEAVQQGLRIINTAIPPLAEGASLPSIFDLAANLRTLGYRTGIDEQSLRPVSKHFTAIARRENFPIGVPAAYDCAQYVHQVPGGMISNLQHQLREVGAEHRLGEALEEAVRVRADFGYPIMVTPLSQFVGSQAAINVIVGKRYQEVTDQTIHYALGNFGGDVAALMDPETRAKILDRPRARALAALERPNRSLEEIRRDLGAEGASDEDLLLRYLMRKEDVEAMRSAGPVKEYITGADPLVTLVADLSRFSAARAIRISKPGFDLTLAKNA
ncbi:MAG: biotin carboxyl carrier protein [Betaproteobacteria bacterium]|nr:biotin carboxyl carrier protein [Betaproteobacteria bacterium]